MRRIVPRESTALFTFLAPWLALVPLTGCVLDEEGLDTSETSAELTRSPATAGRPSVVRIFIDDGVGDDVTCTASILSRHWILTAAHCLQSQAQGSSIRVRTGINGEIGLYSGPGYFTQHPDYDHWAYDNEDDVGLIRLVNGGLNGITEQMSLYDGTISESDDVIVLGYGRGTDPGQSEYCSDGQAGTKREQDFNLNGADHEQLIFDQGTTKICPGDSGGPWLMPSDSHTYVAAVTSLVNTLNNNAESSRMSAKRSWIQQVVGTSSTPAKCGQFFQLDETNVDFFGCYESAQGVRPNAISAGRTHACAVLYDGRARCWGDNQSGQLGDGTTTDRDMPVTSMWGAAGSSLLQIAAGWYHTCATTNGNEATCWGSNTSGQIGNPSLASGLYTEGQRVQFADGTALTDVRSIAAGGTHSCALTWAGRVYCWGANSRGQLGNDSTTSSTAPTLVGQYEVLENDPGFRSTAIAFPLPRRFIPIENVIAIEAGYRHTCAIKSDNTAHCWGDNVWGQLGNGTTTQSNKPVPVSALTNVFRISAGYGHTCATYGTAGDRAACWGFNAFGQLGNGTTTNAATPRTITVGLGTSLEVSAGYLQTCFVGSTRNQKCAGYNAEGELGNNTTTNSSTLVTTVMEADARVPAAGNEFTCTFKHAGTVACTGRNTDGQLGANTTQKQLTPFNVHHLHHLPGAP
jgi:alpha-tubulin suppressor-like RCC1 family protein/V8-like Glu-specific endopeptidase